MASHSNRTSGATRQAPHDAPAEPGDGGPLLSDEAHLRSDLQLLQRAIKERWEIPAAVFRALPSEVIRIAFDGQLSTRDRLRAVEVMLSMHRQNQRPLPQHEQNRDDTSLS